MTTPAPAVRLPIPNGWQLTMNFVQSGQPSAVVLGFSDTDAGGINNTEAQALLNASWLAFRDCTVTTVSCTGGVLRHVGPGGLPPFELIAPPSPTGVDPGGSSVAAGSALIRWRTANSSRNGRGRTFLPAIPAGWLDATGRGIHGAAQTVLQTAITRHLSNTGSYAKALTPAVLSFTKGQAYVITSGSPSPVIGIQRRRMR